MYTYTHQLTHHWMRAMNKNVKKSNNTFGNGLQVMIFERSKLLASPIISIVLYDL